MHRYRDVARQAQVAAEAARLKADSARASAEAARLRAIAVKADADAAQARARSVRVDLQAIRSDLTRNDQLLNEILDALRRKSAEYAPTRSES